jgi:hypothetical protein
LPRGRWSSSTAGRSRWRRWGSRAQSRPPPDCPRLLPDDLPRFPPLRRLRGSDYETMICATLARYDAGMANATLLRRLAVAVAKRLQTASALVVYDSDQPQFSRRRRRSLPCAKPWLPKEAVGTVSHKTSC